MSRLLNPTHPNPLILLLRSCLADWSSDRYFFSLAQPRTLAQQLFITAGPSLEISLLPSQLRLIVVLDLLSCKWLCCVHKRYHVHPCEISLLHSCYRMNKLFLIHLDPFFTTSSGYLSFTLHPVVVRTPLVTHSLNFIIVNGAEGGSEGAFDIWEAQYTRRKKQRGSWDEGGCHHCSGTSKDSSADVSKQDGCQVSLVNYLSNKNRLMFMRHAQVCELLCAF